MNNAINSFVILLCICAYMHPHLKLKNDENYFWLYEKVTVVIYFICHKKIKNIFHTKKNMKKFEAAIPKLPNTFLYAKFLDPFGTIQEIENLVMRKNATNYFVENKGIL